MPRIQNPAPHAARDLPIRSLAKAVTWRVSGSVATAFLVYLATGAIHVALAIGGLEVIVKMGLYYVHERVWERIDLGRVARSERKVS
ncbi:MAG: DUF2061 domain-containing protein [Oligoflexia bacterium]|nr:DUF2061 domain-containing protein [Oligoflexia bacterium]